MSSIENMAGLLALAFLRYLPAIVLPMLSPLRWAPPMLRIVLALGLAWITALALPPDAALSNVRGAAGWISAAFGELAVGVVFGLSVALPMAALHTAGWLVDVQAGIGTATLFNPGSQGDAQSLLGTAIMLAATVLFFTLDLHLDLYRGLVASTAVLPLGQFADRLDPSSVLAMVGSSFLLGLMVALPIVLGLFVVDVGVAYATRSMPQANVYFLALPMKVLIAMCLLVASLRLLPMLLSRLYQDAFARIPSMLGV
jgi:flagellar biosynthesis protein FliR